MPSVFDSIARFLNADRRERDHSAAARSWSVLMSALLWATRRTTNWFIARVLARRGVDVGLREALGAVLRYGLITLGGLVILQSAAST